MSWVQTTLSGVCKAKKGGLALHFGLESASKDKIMKFNTPPEAKDFVTPFNFSGNIELLSDLEFVPYQKGLRESVDTESRS